MVQSLRAATRNVNLREAGQVYTEALSIQQTMGAKGSAATSTLGLAAVALESNDPAQAETSARAAIEVFHAEKDAVDEILARLVLVRSLLARNKLPDAQTELTRAVALVTNESPAGVRYSVSILSERLRAADAKQYAPKAITSLQKLAREAAKAAMPAFALEARLAIGEIEFAEGRKAPAQTELKLVVKEAQTRGFSLLAQKATAQMNSSR